MAKQSLFSACKRVFRDGISGTYTVGNNDIFLELYSQQDIDQNNEIGNSSEENIVVVAGDTITIPEDYTLTPVKPKKSLVVICNTFVNNGTVSMYQKAPNVLPHDFYIIGKQDSYDKEIVIPAYANNGTSAQFIQNGTYFNGGNGTNRQCGGGGSGEAKNSSNTIGSSGSGYAFGGGAGGGGVFYNAGNGIGENVDSIYPMRGGNAKNDGIWEAQGGCGNPAGINTGTNPTPTNGCGGRIIVFCCNFTNNGTINVNGSSPIAGLPRVYGGGGASGAGAIDIFYTILPEEGTMTAKGGTGVAYGDSRSGNGGDGSITLTPWAKSSVLKPTEKYMSKENMVYFLTNYIQRLKQGED